MKFHKLKPTLRFLVYTVGALLLSPSTVSATSINILASFQGTNAGTPNSGVVEDNQGNLFGTTHAGGTSGYGTVFEYTPSSGINILASFDSKTGSPNAGLVEDSQGNLFGTTYDGGTSGYGTVFEYSHGSGISTLASFDGANPNDGLVEDSQGNFFGTTYSGGKYDVGTVFEYTPGSGITTLASFDGNLFFNGTNSGKGPLGKLVEDSQGNLFGTTTYGGTSNNGTVFEYTPGSGITTLASFDGTNGAHPSGRLVEDSQGNLFGTTGSGGTSNNGTVFEYTPGSGISTLASFNDTSTANLRPGLVEDSQGNLYGIAGDKTDNNETVFKYTPGNGISTLASFDGTFFTNVGGYQGEGLLIDNQGNLFGTSNTGNPYLGGKEFAYSSGTVFEVSTTSTPTSTKTPPPSLLTLANLSGNVYENLNSNDGGYVEYGPNNKLVDYYTSIDTNCSLIPSTCSYIGFKSEAYKNSDGTQIVVAFRGTDTSTWAKLLKTLAADASFKGTTPSPDLSQSVSDAVSFLQYIEKNNPGTNITLTGHSLGGAIAQLLGQASGFTTDAFNAPGAAALYNSLLPILAPIVNPLIIGNENNNYRLYGDQISLFGTPIGPQITLADPQGTPPFQNVSLYQAVFDNPGTFLTLHSINTVIQQIQNTPQPVSTVGEPNVAQALENDLVPVFPSIPVNSPSQILLNFAIVVDGGLQYILDPSNGTDFLLSENNGSPDFATIELPTLPGVSFYDIRYKTGDTWSAFQQLQPDVLFALGSGVDGLEFAPFDLNGQAVTLSDSFLFGLSFSSTGTFSGALTITQPASVPEPSSLWLVLPLPVLLAISKHLQVRSKI